MKRKATQGTSKSQEILTNRINFKLYAAKQHLDKLKAIEKKHGHIGKRRLYAEMEIDCFFAQIVGAKDSLLMKINEELKLGIDVREVDLDEVYTKLKWTNKEHILKELKTLSCQKGSWFWLLNELRNHSIHRNMLNKQISVSQFEDVNTGTSNGGIPRVYFLANPLDKNKVAMDKPVIEYLEESLGNMKNLINNTINKEPALKSKQK